MVGHVERAVESEGMVRDRTRTARQWWRAVRGVNRHVRLRQLSRRKAHSRVAACNARDVSGASSVSSVSGADSERDTDVHASGGQQRDVDRIEPAFRAEHSLHTGSEDRHES